jgi:hypothetical protein
VSTVLQILIPDKLQFDANGTSDTIDANGGMNDRIGFGIKNKRLVYAIKA